MTTITLTATQLRDLLTPVLPHASKDDTLPVLTAVHIRTAGRYVTAIATDRYRIGFQRVALDPEPEAGFDAVVSVVALKRLLAMFRPTRSHNPAVRLTVDDGRLTATAASTLDDGGEQPNMWFPGDSLAGATLTFQLVDATHPPIDRLVRDALNGKPEDGATAPSFNPEFLADFRIGQPRHLPMRISATGAVSKPWLIRIGDDFIGLIVPLRYADPDSAPGDAATWLPLLDVPAEETKAA